MRRLVLLSTFCLAAACAALGQAQTYGGQTYGDRPDGGQPPAGQGYGAPSYGGPADDPGYGRTDGPRSDERYAPPPIDRDGRPPGDSSESRPAPRDPAFGRTQPDPTGSDGYGRPEDGGPGYAPSRRSAPEASYGPASGDDRQPPQPTRSPPLYAPSGGEAHSGYGSATEEHGPNITPLSGLLTCEGGAFGRDLGCRLSSGDRLQAEAATLSALDEGEARSWRNPQTGSYGQVSVLADGYGRGGYSDLSPQEHRYGPGGRCRVVEERVTPPGGRVESQRFRACPVGEAGYDRDGYGPADEPQESARWSFSRL